MRDDSDWNDSVVGKPHIRCLRCGRILRGIEIRNHSCGAGYDELHWDNNLYNSYRRKKVLFRTLLFGGLVVLVVAATYFTYVILR